MTCNVDIASGIVQVIESMVDREDNRQKSAQFAGINSQEKRVCGIYSDVQTLEHSELQLVPNRCFPVVFSLKNPIELTTEQQKALANKVAELVAGNPKLSCALTLCEPGRPLSESKVIAFFVSRITLCAPQAKL